MSTLRAVSSTISAAVGLTISAAAAGAQAPPAECKALIDAELKVVTTPHHAYSTNGPGGANANGQSGETISVGGANYTLYRGQWRRSPMTVQMRLDQMKENVANTKAWACRRVGQELVNGEAADVYTSHNENEDTKADARVWVAQGSGLVLRVEEDLAIRDAGKRHESIRYEYTNVHAPSGAR